MTDIPSGYIIEWIGAVDSIPDGWHPYDMEKDELGLRVRFLNPKPEYHSAYSMGGDVKYWKTILIVKD